MKNPVFTYFPNVLVTVLCKRVTVVNSNYSDVTALQMLLPKTMGQGWKLQILIYTLRIVDTFKKHYVF